MGAQVDKTSQGGQLFVVLVEVGFAECFSKLKLAASVELVVQVDGLAGLVVYLTGLVDGLAGLVDGLTGLADEVAGWIEYFVEPAVAVENLLMILV